MWMALAATLAMASPLDEPLKTGVSTPADAAVVVGIEEYFKLPEVPHATADARLVRDLLIYTRGVPAANVRLLDRGANRETMLAAVGEAAGQAKRGGTVWVYFAGHGAASPDTGERMLLGDDVRTELASFAARSVTVGELKEAAGQHGHRVQLLLDACYTGQTRSGDALMPGARFAVPSYASQPSGKALEWSAASANEFSGPLPGMGHGAFTWAMVGALRGWADGQISGTPDGRVTAEEASLYVEEALRNLGLHDQHPVMSVGDGAGWVLTAAPGRLESAPDLRAIVASSVAPTRVQAAVPPAPIPGRHAGLGTREPSVVESLLITSGMGIEPHDLVFGASGHVVTLVQFTGFGCPYCAKVSPTMERVLRTYDGKVRLVIKDFPLTNKEDARRAAIAAHCANDQGLYAPMASLLYAKDADLSELGLQGAARRLGLNMGTFVECLGSGRHDAGIDADLALGVEKGVIGIPTTFIEGEEIGGSQPYETFAAAIDEALAKQR